MEANEAASRMLGMSRAELVGRTVESIDLPVGHLSVLPRLEDEGTPESWAREVAAGHAEAEADADERTPARKPSRREREVLALLARGSTDVQIAALLSLSPATVQTHVRNAKAKLGARTRAQAVALSLVSGLIELD